MTDLDTFTRAYIATALWVGVEAPEGHEMAMLCDLPESDLAPETLAQMITDCARFQAENKATIAAAGTVKGGPDFDVERRAGHDFDVEGRAGHDFWLTRNNHGAGFWDGGWPEPMAAALTRAAEAFGECNLYFGGDDGEIYAQ